MAVATAVAIASGHLLVGFFLLIVAAVPDLLDGAVAKASGTASPRGAFFDSVSDRVTDSLVLGGIAWHLATTSGGHAALLPFAVLGTSTLISYERAKAESLGYSAKGGLMERAERIIALCLGLLVPVLLVPVLWVMLVLTSLTAVQRFVKVWRQASAPRPPDDDTKTALGRWRTWRELSAERAQRRPTRTSAPTAWRTRRHGTSERSWRRGAGTRP